MRFATRSAVLAFGLSLTCSVSLAAQTPKYQDGLLRLVRWFRKLDADWSHYVDKEQARQTADDLGRVSERLLRLEAAKRALSRTLLAEPLDRASLMGTFQDLSTEVDSLRLQVKALNRRMPGSPPVDSALEALSSVLAAKAEALEIQYYLVGSRREIDRKRLQAEADSSRALLRAAEDAADRLQRRLRGWNSAPAPSS